MVSKDKELNQEIYNLIPVDVKKRVEKKKQQSTLFDTFENPSKIKTKQTALNIQKKKEKTYYVIVKKRTARKKGEAVKDYLALEEIPVSKLEEKKKELQKDYQEGKNKGFLVTDDAKIRDQFIKEQQRLAAKESRQIEQQIREYKYRIPRKVAAEVSEMIQQVPIAAGEREYRGPEVNILPAEKPRRSRFFAPENISDKYQDQSDFSPRYISPYRPVSKNQTTFRPVFVQEPEPYRSFSPPVAMNRASKYIPFRPKFVGGRK